MWIIIIKILKNTIQIKTTMYWLSLMIWLLIYLVINKNHNVLIVFDDMIANILSNKKLHPVLTELFIRGRKSNISVVFIAQTCFAVPKNIKLNSTQHFITKIQNKRERQQLAYNHSSDIDFQGFMNLYEKCTSKPYFFWLLIILLHQITLQAL